MTVQELLNADFKSLADEFLRWWVRELKALIPERIQRHFVRQTERLVVELLIDGTVIANPSASTGPVLLGHAGRSETTSALSQLKPAQIAGGVTLLLPPEQVLQRQLVLPLTPARDLRPLLGFELERRTPLTNEQAYFDFRILSRDRATRQMTVELFVAKRETVDNAVADLKGMGIEIQSVGVKPESDEPWAVNLLPRRPLSTSAKLRRWLPVGIGALAIVLAIGLVWADFARRDALISALQAEAQQKKITATAAQTLKSKVDALAARVTFVSNRRRTISLAIILNEIARLMPDDSWATNFELNESKLRVRGLAKTATDLIQRIDASQLFESAHFEAPVMHAANADNERFDIGFTLRPGVSP